jgi:UPF0042 nucleotide-binding protein
MSANAVQTLSVVGSDSSAQETPVPRHQGRVTIITFGFKYGAPPSNYSFDVSFVKNPARDPRWGMFSTASADGMAEFVLSQPNAVNFLDSLIPMVGVLSQCDDDLRIALGCNAGRHRSRIIAAELQRRLQAEGIASTIIHREEQL